MWFINKKTIKILKITGMVLCAFAIFIFIFAYFHFFYTLGFENLNFKNVLLLIIGSISFLIMGLLCGTVSELAEKIRRLEEKDENNK